MRKTREEKAITLIALIITIVVLLILAVVAINAVTGDGIIQHAVNAKTQYENTQAKEQDILSYYEGYLTNKGNYGPWKENGDNIVMKDKEGNEVKIALGAEVTYVPVAGKTYTSPGSVTGIEEDQVFTVNGTETSWKVIGIENGKIILLSNNLIAPKDQTQYIFTGLNAPTRAEEELNKICSIYKDDKVVDTARSINENDIFGLCQVTEEDKIASANNDYFKYNVKYTYMYRDNDNDGIEDTMMYKKDEGEYTPYSREEVLFPDGTKVDSTNKGPKSVISKYYSIDLDDRRCGNIIVDTDIYWLATSTIWVYDKAYSSNAVGDFEVYLKIISKNIASTDDIGCVCVFQSRSGGWVANANAKVRPVVVLKTDTQLVKDGTDASGNVKYKVVQ